MAMSPLKRLRTLILELPQQLQLAYCLARDPRTPAAPKAALGAALAVILNPLVDVPMWVPVVGQMDIITLTMLALRAFNSQVPKELRTEVELQIKEHRSVFDRDLAKGAGTASQLLQAGSRLRHLRMPAVKRPTNGARPEPTRPHEPAPWYRSEGSEQSPGGTGLPGEVVDFPPRPHI
jgi:uncharacterized membrane protein YkvA (DUF1232 family)